MRSLSPGRAPDARRLMQIKAEGETNMKTLTSLYESAACSGKA